MQESKRGANPTKLGDKDRTTTLMLTRLRESYHLAIDKRSLADNGPRGDQNCL